MPVEFSTDDDKRLFELTVGGKVSDADFEKMADPLRAFIARHGKIRMIEKVTQLEGFDPEIVPKGIKMDVEVADNIERLAVIGEKSWIKAATNMADTLLSAEIRHFDLTQDGAARDWVLDG